MTWPFGLTDGAALWLAIAIFGAAILRGTCGFGFSALIVSAAALATDPLHLVPVVLLADILLTVQQARGIKAEVDWRRVRLLLIGAIPGVPLGIWLLSGIGPDTARLVIAVCVLAMCALLLAGWRMQTAASGGAHVATGIVSGVANGAAVGGLPVAAFFAAKPIPAAIFRAMLIAHFTLMDLWTLPLMAWAGLITRDTPIATAMGRPLMVAGIALGSRQFRRAKPAGFRRFAIPLLATRPCLGLVRSLW